MKNKKWIIIGAVAAVVILLAALFIGGYNSLVEGETEVESAWSDIEVDLQRRADLIPNLVETVKEYKDYEQSTLTAVTEARNAFINAKGAEEKSEAYNAMDSALSVWVNAVTEAYPELKSTEQFKSLMDSLEGTENRIAYARTEYNDEVKEYNADLRKFPKSIIAAMFGFEKAEFFNASPAANENVTVDFD